MAIFNKHVSNWEEVSVSVWYHNYDITFNNQNVYEIKYTWTKLSLLVFINSCKNNMKKIESNENRNLLCGLMKHHSKTFLDIFK